MVPPSSAGRVEEPEALRSEAEDQLVRELDRLPITVGTNSLLPTIPRETEGYNPTDGPAVDDSAAPFDDVVDMPIMRRLDPA